MRIKVCARNKKGFFLGGGDGELVLGAWFSCCRLIKRGVISL
ncbi:hypothetical protein GCWU000325_02634 [Alloprevotella tannerae ATCC 51259]|uniref:Uncharacterized protein n=1 Tax=Alloprevotella tannerae ATCC 51259 TaxID=626522 RepID=C9LK69_9BACT|nr:hypothetical protein GCWU000325_02634 [Alloprevotella tannerae ATCC 51259]